MSRYEQNRDAKRRPGSGKRNFHRMTLNYSDKVTLWKSAAKFDCARSTVPNGMESRPKIVWFVK